MAAISLSIGGVSTNSLSIGSDTVIVLHVGTSTGSSTVAGIGVSVYSGSTSGSTTVNGIGIPQSVGNTSGDSTVSGISDITILRFAPNRVCENYFFDGTSIHIPISCLPGLTAEEANSVSGDWREIFQAFCLLNHDWYNLYKPSGGLDMQTYRSFKLDNPNARNSIFQYGIGELRTFLEEFNVTYKVSKLKDEN